MTKPLGKSALTDTPSNRSAHVRPGSPYRHPTSRLIHIYLTGGNALGENGILCWLHFCFLITSEGEYSLMCVVGLCVCFWELPVQILRSFSVGLFISSFTYWFVDILICPHLSSFFLIMNIFSVINFENISCNPGFCWFPLQHLCLESLT